MAESSLDTERQPDNWVVQMIAKAALTDRNRSQIARIKE